MQGFSMDQNANEEKRWTINDLERLPDNAWLSYEIIDGELFISKSPHLRHQRACGKILRPLDDWSEPNGIGEAFLNPEIIFSDADMVIPDVIWISNDRLAEVLDDSGHLTGAPELVVEVLSPGRENERRDKEAKLMLYSKKGVQEYWIAQWELQQVEVYRRGAEGLELIETLKDDDELSSPLMPGFNCAVTLFFN
jgi:Uma2 family endonuclease